MNNSDRVYQELLQRTLKQLQQQITSLERKNRGLRAITDQTAVEIEGYKTEYQRIAQELQSYNQRIEVSKAGETGLDFIDDKVDKIIERQQDSVDKIRQLESLKQQVTTKRYQRKIDKQIKHQQEIIQKLQKKHGRLNMAQRVIMYPKYYRTMRKLKLLSRKQGKVNIAEANIRDNELLKQTLNPNSIIDNIKGIFYDIRGQYYQKKLNHAIDVLERMKEKHGNIRLQGANVTVLPKKVVETKRQNMNSASEKKTTQKQVPQAEPAVQAKKTTSQQSTPIKQQETSIEQESIEQKRKPIVQQQEVEKKVEIQEPEQSKDSHIIISGQESVKQPSPIILPPEDKTITAASLAEEAVQIKQQNQQAMQQQQAQEFKKAA